MVIVINTVIGNVFILSTQCMHAVQCNIMPWRHFVSCLPNVAAFQLKGNDVKMAKNLKSLEYFPFTQAHKIIIIKSNVINFNPNSPPYKNTERDQWWKCNIIYIAINYVFKYNLKRLSAIYLKEPSTVFASIA